jgi:hypothetical protein
MNLTEQQHTLNARRILRIILICAPQLLHRALLYFATRKKRGAWVHHYYSSFSLLVRVKLSVVAVDFAISSTDPMYISAKDFCCDKLAMHVRGTVSSL